MTESANGSLNIDSLRNPSELPHHWKLRKEFLNVHKGKFDLDRLTSLSHLFVNIKCLGLSYPQEVMVKVEELGKSIDTKLIEEATVERSYESRDSDRGEPQQQLRPNYQQQPSHRFNNSGNNYQHRNNNYNRNYNNYQNNNAPYRQPFGGGRPQSRPRFQQNHNYRNHPYQQYRQNHPQ